MDEILAFINSTITNNVSLPQTLYIGQLEEGNSIAMQLAPSDTETEFIADRSKIINVSVLLLSKNSDQQVALNNLELITDYIGNLASYPQPSTNNFQWITTEITTYPNFVDKEDSQNYIFSAIINNKILK